MIGLALELGGVEAKCAAHLVRERSVTCSGERGEPIKEIGREAEYVLPVERCG